jgi:ferredoxin-NADP reductase
MELQIQTQTGTKPIDVAVGSVENVASEIKLYSLRPVAARALPSYTPGAHIDLHLANGKVRQYSLLNPFKLGDPYAIAVKRKPNSLGGSEYIFDRFKPGHTLQISNPRNHFPLHEGSSHSVLFAGGIGVTPIWCMAQWLKSAGASMEMHFTCRSPSEIPFASRLACHPDVHLSCDSDRNGSPLDLEAIVKGTPHDSHLYCCGPRPMLDAFLRATASWPSAQIHFEAFEAKAVTRPHGSFTVRLARSGQEFLVRENETILDVLIRAKIDVRYLCEIGICGECAVKVLAGAIDHRDATLADIQPAPTDAMTICCSRAKGGLLVIDL